MQSFMLYSYRSRHQTFFPSVFRAFDKDTDNKVNAEEWVKGLSIFLRGSLREKIKFCFDVYDMNSDGWITKEEMFHMLKFCLPQRQQEEDPDEGVRDLVECALKKLVRYTIHKYKTLFILINLSCYYYQLSYILLSMILIQYISIYTGYTDSLDKPIY